MKKAILVGVLTLAATNAHAEVGAFFGVTYAFGSDNGVGLTLQATSTRHEDRAIAAGGVSFYPFATHSKFGIPLGVGYQWKNFAGIAGYDILLKTPVVSGGYVDTRDDGHSAPAPAPVPTPD